MEQLIIRHPVLTLSIWILLNFLHCFFNFLNMCFYKNAAAECNFKFGAKYNKRFFLKLLLWLIFGTIMLAAFRKAMLDEDITAYEYFIWVGALFFLEIGYLLSDVLAMMKYFVYRKEIPKTTYSFKTSIFAYSFEFFGYAVIMLLSFIVSNNPFLLGGSIGLALGGILYILELTRKKNYPKIENTQKIEVK